MELINVSFHAAVERADRLHALEEVLGFTNVALEVVEHEHDRKYQLTSSGIMIIRNLRFNTVVTAFMANINQCTRLYRMAGKSQVSPKIYKRVIKNSQRHPELFEIYS